MQGQGGKQLRRFEKVSGSHFQCLAVQDLNT